MNIPSSCMTMNMGAEAGSMPAKLFDSIRATVTAGLAKLVEDVNQYDPPMHAPTASGTAAPRPVRTHPWMTSSTPTVAITHEVGRDRAGAPPTI